MRQVLPSRRSCHTFDLVFRNHRITLTTGHFPDGRLGEVFLNIGKSGNDLDAIARDSAIVLSLAIQHGVAIETVAHVMSKDTRGHALSILGAIAFELTGQTP
jgi:hypothetical protein